MAEVLAAELGTDAHVLTYLVHTLFPLQVSECPTVLIARGGQTVVIPAAGHLDGLEGHLGRQTADDDGQVVGRACGRPDRLDLLLQKHGQAVRVQQGFGLLEKERLVRRAAPLGDEEEVVGVTFAGVQLDLCWQVRLGVCLREHVLGRHLRVSEIGHSVGVIDAFADVGLVLVVGDDAGAALSNNDGGAGVLAARQHSPSSDVGIFQELKCNKPVVV
mmetsp:Transcript_31987/g.79323  ORF Transcript_31987/g.79323 Transcript_31987/m.79323 type:complete len:217 (-) Transcript_31987:381-1031(-)